MANTTSNVKGTNNNIGQEIAKQQASDVVICTMTEAEHKERKEFIYNAQARGREAEWSIMTALVSAKERHEQVLDGYDDTEKSFNQWVMDAFEIKDTQVKQMVRLVRIYGSMDAKGEWSVLPKFIAYGKEKLDIIQRHKDFKTKDSFDDIVIALDINPYTSTSVIKELVNVANGKALPEKEKSDNKADKPKDSKKTETEVKESETYKMVAEKAETAEKQATDLKTFIANWYHYANDKKMTDKNFREEFIKAVDELQK